jgi:hypothetical protein
MNRDTIKLIALELDLPTLTNLCNTSKKFNDFICKDNLFWKNKLNKDYSNTIGKFSERTDFRRIYQSLINKKEHTYAIFRSQEDPIEFFNIIVKDFNYHEAYKKVEEKIGDVIEDDVFEFKMIGEFPEGTEIWITYDDDTEAYPRTKGFLTQAEAIDDTLSKIKNIFEYDLEDGMESLIVADMEKPGDVYMGNYYKFVEKNKDHIESKKEEYITKYYISKNIDDVLEDARNKLLKNGHYKLYNSTCDNYDILIIKKFIL